jgi:hypothetical protein
VRAHLHDHVLSSLLGLQLVCADLRGGVHMRSRISCAPVLPLIVELLAIASGWQSACKGLNTGEDGLGVCWACSADGADMHASCLAACVQDSRPCVTATLGFGPARQSSAGAP